MRGSAARARAGAPGLVQSALTRDFPCYLQPIIGVANIFWQSPEQGGTTAVWLATSAEAEGITGKYFRKMKELRSSEASYDEVAQGCLVTLAREMVGI